MSHPLPITPAPARAIARIPHDAIHRICAGQVVVSLSACVKELIENALDAGATNVEIRLKDHGADVVEVSDNGTGVSVENFAALTTKYATSKLETFEDLQQLGTFGFRGEALSSLCGISSGVSVTTRTAEDDSGTKIEYDRDGAIVSTETVPRSVGTTVSARELFAPLPVRRKEFLRNVKREYGKALLVVQAYALMSKHVRILCTHQSGKYGRANVLHTRGGEDASVRENIVTVFGSKMVACMREVDVVLAGSTGCKIVGYISKPEPGCGRAGADRQFYYVNGRPVDVPKIAKVVNELYRSFNAAQAPMVVLDFQLPLDSYDVNVTPDKRKIMLHLEQELLARTREALGELFAPSRYTYAVTPAAKAPVATGEGGDIKMNSDDDEGGDDGGSEDASPSPYYAGRESFESMLHATQNSDERRGTKRDAASMSTQKNLQNFGFTRETTAVALGGGWTSVVKEEPVTDEDAAMAEVALDDIASIPAVKDEDLETSNDVGDEGITPRAKDDIGGGRDSLEVEEDGDDVEPMGHDAVAFDDVLLAKTDETRSARGRESIGSGTVSFSFESMIQRRRNAKVSAETLRKNAAQPTSTSTATYASASIPNDKDAPVPDVVKAASELERVFDKSDFTKMRIVGQFNLGFILATLGDDLFIVDQHASDEIYNFEKLQRTTTLNRQPLIAPVSLDLTAAEEQVVLRNMPVFLQNGFGFCDVAETGADANNASAMPASACCDSRPSFGTLKLNAVPFIKNVAFDKSDVHELVALLDQGGDALPPKSQLSIGLASTFPTTTPTDATTATAHPPRIIRPSKVRAALAMRACRSSIMIGDALDRRRMRSALRRLATLAAPWNCPHGRPTMRHLKTLR